MDPVCHSLAGLAIGQAGLRRRTPLALPTLVLAANAPDVDVITMVTTDVWMYYRRGWTHGPLAMAAMPLLLTGLMLAWDRLVRRRRRPDAAPVRPGATFMLALVGTLSHPLLDYMNSFGIRLLMPFSGRWFYGDALYIVDPWLYVILGAGVGAALVGRHRADGGAAAARIALAVAAAYVVAMFGSGLWARQAVQAGLARAGQPAARFMVTPVIGNPLRREVLVDLGDRYEKGFVDFSPGPRFRPAGYGVEIHADDPLARAAAATRLGRQYLTWARFPFFVVERTLSPPRVQLNDARYSGPMGTDGWSGAIVPVPEVAMDPETASRR
ncbi:MAG: metal-dependent hydrolase [Vicinamibacterales bacterium]